MATIETAADLLSALRTQEVQVLDEQSIKHGPMIGDMYEGLTRDMLNKVLFDGLDLRVVKGAIVSEDGRISPQTDCMVVQGEGKKLPFTDHHIYPIGQVIAVIEVKKNLYSSGLDSAFQQIRGMVSMVESNRSGGRLLADAYRSIVLQPLPTVADFEKKQLHERMIYYALLMDSILPVRIVLGYHGYRTEHSLREALINHFEAHVGETPSKHHPELTPQGFPNLIICDNKSVVKINGMPYASPIVEGIWPLLATYPSQPDRILLEVLWTRLDYQFGLGSSMFDDGLSTEALRPLLRVKPEDLGNTRGWLYSLIDASEERLNSVPEKQNWQPSELTAQQVSVLAKMTDGSLLSIDDPEFNDWILREQLDKDAFILQLVETGLVALSPARQLQILTVECVVVALPDGRIVAGENKAGRLTNWVEKFMKKWQS